MGRQASQDGVVCSREFGGEAPPLSPQRAPVIFAVHQTITACMASWGRASICGLQLFQHLYSCLAYILTELLRQRDEGMCSNDCHTLCCGTVNDCLSPSSCVLSLADTETAVAVARTTDKWTPGLGQGAAQIFSSNSQTKQKQHDKNNRGREAVLLRQVKLNRLHGQNKKENKDKCKTVHPLSHALKTASSSTSSRQKKRKIMHECRFNPFVAVKSRRDILQVSCNMSYSFTALLAH